MGIDSPIEWDRESPVTPETIYVDACIMDAPAGSRIWLIEPCHENNRVLFERVLKHGNRYAEIWTADAEILAAWPHAKFLTNAGCWIRPADRRIWPKTKNISTIASNKRGGTGYDMRHEAIRRFPQIDAFGPEYRQLSGESQHHKIDALRDYRFHLVIENCRRDFFFSEKLIDCFMTGTVPIYGGCPSTGRFFDLWGMIRFETLNELGDLMMNTFEISFGDLTERFPIISEELYWNAWPAIKDNFERAKAYTLTEEYIVRNLLTPKARPYISRT
jgi:hypothetical protein